MSDNNVTGSVMSDKELRRFGYQWVEVDKTGDQRDGPHFAWVHHDHPIDFPRFAIRPLLSEFMMSMMRHGANTLRRLFQNMMLINKES
jgi:hypothetical protein